MLNPIQFQCRVCGAETDTELPSCPNCGTYNYLSFIDPDEFIPGQNDNDEGLGGTGITSIK